MKEEIGMVKRKATKNEMTRKVSGLRKGEKRVKSREEGRGAGSVGQGCMYLIRNGRQCLGLRKRKKSVFCR